MEISEAQLAKIAEAVAKATVEQVAQDRRNRCDFCHDKQNIERHEQHHQFLDDWIGFLDRVNNIRWGIAKSILQVGAVSFLALLGTLLWRHFKG